jgi:hypothetical protein
MTERLFGEFHTEAFYDSRYESLTIEEVMGRQKMPKTVKRRRVAAVFGEGGAVLRSRRGSLSARYAMPRLAWLVLVAAGGVAGFSPLGLPIRACGRARRPAGVTGKGAGVVPGSTPSTWLCMGTSDMDDEQKEAMLRLRKRVEAERNAELEKRRSAERRAREEQDARDIAAFERVRCMRLRNLLVLSCRAWS